METKEAAIVQPRPVAGNNLDDGSSHQRLSRLRQLKSYFSQKLSKKNQKDNALGGEQDDDTTVELSPDLQIAIGELRENVSLFKKSVNWVKRNPLDVAAIVVPTALGAAGMIGDSDVLTRVSLAIGGGLIGYKKAGLTGAIAGIATGAMLPEATQHMPMGEVAETTANYFDDIPTVAAIVEPAAKKLIGKK